MSETNENEITKKKPVAHIPKLRTPQTIADDHKQPLLAVLSAIHLNNIIPTAFANDIPVFNNEQEERIVASFFRMSRKAAIKKAKGE